MIAKSVNNSWSLRVLFRIYVHRPIVSRFSSLFYYSFYHTRRTLGLGVNMGKGGGGGVELSVLSVVVTQWAADLLVERLILHMGRVHPKLLFD